jgi:CheY-like chemotaxis protein
MVENSESILIIDDDPNLAFVLSERLRNAGYKIESFCDSKEALKRIGQAPPDLLISDVNMPGLNGFEMYDIVRSNSRTKHIPIIIITGIHEARMQVLSLSGRDIYFLSKPIDSRDLMKLVKTALNSDIDN